MPTIRYRAHNALKHGLTAILPVLPGVESQQEWERHLVGVAESLLPQTHLEGLLVERVAHILWRLRRVASYERQATIDSHQALEAQCPAPAALLDQAAADAEWECAPDREDDAPLSLPGLVALLSALPNVPGFSLIRRGAALQLLRTLADEAGGVDLALAGLPGSADQTAEWAREMLNEAVQRVARQAGVSWQVLKQKALFTLTPRLAEAQTEGQQVLAPASAANLLPETDVVDCIIRFEAHLSRQLLTTLHELEALQARRSGRPAPLARIDVTGIPEAAQT